MTKADALKMPARRETVILKVYIHCEECQKQVKKALKKLDGVESIAIDVEMGKVTVVGTVAASTLVKKLAKAGKYAALWSSISSSGGTFVNAKDQKHPSAKDHQYFTKLGADQFNSSSSTASTNINNVHNFCKTSAYNVDIDQFTSAGEGSPYNMNGSYNSGLTDAHYLNSGNKKAKGSKKVSFQGVVGPTATDQASLLTVATTTTTTATRSANPYLRTTNAYPHNSMDSVEYATHMFSDENAQSCSLM